MGKCKNKDNKKTIDNEEVKVEKNPKEDEVNELEVQLKNLQIKYDNLTKANHELEIYIANLQKDFVTKIQEKQIEMNKILDDKKSELEKLNEEKLLNFKTKLFTKDIVDLINTVEQFNKIINTESNNEIINNYLNGFKMFSNMFLNSFENMGINKININVGDDFDESYMEVVEVVESNLEHNKIVSIISNAYKYESNVIKFAKVKVAK